MSRRKRLVEYFATNADTDLLTFKDFFRHAVRHDLIDTNAVGRWFRYGENRDDTVKIFGEDFVETTLRLFSEFTEDVKALAGRGRQDLLHSALWVMSSKQRL